MTSNLEILCDYDRELLAKALGIDEEILNLGFLNVKVEADATYKTTLKVSLIVFVVASALGVVSNVFCIFLMASMKRPLKTSISLLLTLSISDACISSLDIVWFFHKFKTARLNYNVDRRQNILDRVFTSLHLLTDLSGLVTTIMLALVIFLAVRKPMKYSSLMSNRRHSTGINLFIWATSCFVVICFNCILQVMLHSSEETLKAHLQTKEIHAHYYLSIAYRYMILVILGIIMVLNAAIYIQVRVSRMKSSKMIRERRFVLILILITSCFFVTNSPSIFHTIFSDESVFSEVFLSEPAAVLYVLHCASYFIAGWRGLGNTIVYTVRLPEIRKQVLEVFCPERVKRLKKRKTVESLVSRSRSMIDSRRRSGRRRGSTIMKERLASTESIEIACSSSDYANTYPNNNDLD